MAAISGTSGASSTMPFDRSIFSNPEMRPYLEDYYESSYAAMRDRVEGMKDAEANGQAPMTIQMRDGTTGTELSAAQYEAAIPSFDRWLEMQQSFSVFDMVEQSSDMLGHAEEALDRFDKALNPDLPSGVRTVFSDGDSILGYINQSGQLVTHQDGSALQAIADKADKLGLTGEARITYMTQQGTAALARQFPELKVTSYTDETMPTRRAFAEAWYPDHDVTGDYESTLAEFRQSLEGREAWYDQQVQIMNRMRDFLLKSFQEAEAA